MKHSFLILCFLIFIINRACTDIELPFIFSIDDIMMTELKFLDNNNEKSRLITIDLQNDKSLINRNTNQSISDEIINISNKVFKFSYNTCEKWHEQRLSFIYGLNNTSFVNQLKEQKIIKQSQFSFYPIKGDINYKGIIYFDKLNPSLISNKKAKFCEVVNNQWACLLQTITFNNYEYSINDIIQFDTKMFPMVIPYDIYSTLTTKYNLNKCISITVYFDYESKVCKCKDIYTIVQQISLKIDNYHFSFNSSELFIKINDECYFMVFSKKKNIKWVFGTYFLLKYVSTFDNEKKLIVFYEDDISTNNWPFIVLIITLCILMFGITFLLSINSFCICKKDTVLSNETNTQI